MLADACALARSLNAALLVLASGAVPADVLTASKDPSKARRAAAHPDRPGEQCSAEPGAFVPSVSHRRCEGKGDCVEVCPYGVFEVRAIDAAEYQALPLLVRLKLRVHGKRVAYTPNAAACRACGLCVVACPERAITLRPPA